MDHVNQILLNWNRPPDNSNSIRSECGLSIVEFCKLPKMIFKNGQIESKMYIGEKNKGPRNTQNNLGKDAGKWTLMYILELSINLDNKKICDRMILKQKIGKSIKKANPSMLK